MGGEWWAILVTAWVGGVTGVFLNLVKEAIQRRERIRMDLISRQIRHYAWADEGKGRLTTVPFRSSAHVLHMELDLRWINSSRTAIHLEEVSLLLFLGRLQLKIPCHDRKLGQPVSDLRIPAGEAVNSRLSVAVTRWEEGAVFLKPDPVYMRLTVTTSRGHHWSFRLAPLA